MIIRRSAVLLLTILGLISLCHAQQSINLLRNPEADAQAAFWRISGDASIEYTTENGSCFLVRNGGSFSQDVELPPEAVGQYAVFIGRGSSERINPDGAITGLPYLYGYMMGPDRGEVVAYLQAQQMLGRSVVKDAWVQMWGIFKVPEGTTAIRFFLKQALRNGVPHNGSAARFDDLGLYLFGTRAEAEAFVTTPYR